MIRLPPGAARLPPRPLDLDLPYKINKALAGKSGDAAFAAVSSLLQMTFGKGPDELWVVYQNTAF
jgi:hypothetical protein